MATTSLGFRYPASTDAPRVWEDIEHLAEDLNTYLTPFADTSWTAVSTFTNSWANLGGAGNTVAQYRRRSGFTVVAGLVALGSLNPMFVLPAGYRPSFQRYFTVEVNGGTLRIDVKTDGTVLPVIYHGSGTNAYVSLDGLTFPAEQ
jgi:hypothetical protein